nr:hypothetical protein [Tanacetum cinerariifolium]
APVGNAPLSGVSGPAEAFFNPIDYETQRQEWIIRMSDNSYFIHNDVLLTKSKIAFLAGGNHSVLDYITGKKKPTADSIKNFGRNIASRAYIAEVCKSKFLHVIFPDKQSVMQDEFPLKNTVRLGDLYTTSLASTSLKHFVLFPTQALQSHSELEPFQKLDTHLSDHGSLIVLRAIVKCLGEDAQIEIDELQSLITVKQINNGDLGNKFSPKLTQESTLLKTNWNYQHFGSEGTFNNGQIDIYLSPNAPIQKKLLIFGD